MLTKTSATEINYKARHGKIKQALQKLAEDSGEMLTPRIVLDAAHSKSSVLHDRFEWDDKIGGEKYRLMEARLLINSVKVEFMGEKQDKYVNAFTEVNNTPLHAYYPVERVMSEDELHKAVLQQAVRELELAQEKYKRYKEMKGVINTEKLRKVKEKVEAK